MVSVMYKFNTVVLQNILEYCGCTEHSLNTAVCTEHFICHTHPPFPPFLKVQRLNKYDNVHEGTQYDVNDEEKIRKIHEEP